MALYVSRSGVLCAERRPIRIVRTRLPFMNEGQQSGRKKADSARTVEKTVGVLTALWYRQSFVLFRVGAQKTEYDLMRTL